jgi:hypothetical protein
MVTGLVARTAIDARIAANDHSPTSRFLVRVIPSASRSELARFLLMILSNQPTVSWFEGMNPDFERVG